ncbi:colicin-like pore-forming protein [Pseudomonas sp. B28(2017)]|uniref:colicin-like pore-forming protein n=1 Tax=Pseudomonas sp. B28(2017) TaxID=1981730 RepID=UPI000A1E1EA8|nr:colicin-like pore-forming protein [Pseudomonas sp. B28(2017)]
MPQGNVTLPPIVVTPEPPLPKPSGPIPGSGVVAKPLSWNGKVVSSFEVDMFFSQKGIRVSDRYTISVIVTVATAQRNIEQSYTAYLPQLPADIDAEIAAAVGIYSLSKLEQTKAEKAVVDSLIIQNDAELAKSNTEANAFFGRNVLAVEIKKSAVDFANLLQNSRVPGTGLGIYKSWEASAIAAYRAKILTEKIRILSEKSVILTQAVVTAQVEEDARLLAEAEARRLAEEAAHIAAEKASYEAAIMFLSDVNKDILVRYGENMSKVALDLQENISGKKVRSYAQAMETFEKVRVNPNTKLNSQDTKAVVNALKTLDQATLADNVTRLGKAFGVVGKIFQINAIREHTIVGIETGDWKPLGLELESIAVGIGAGAVLAGVMVLAIPAFVGSVAGVVTVAILMALAGAYFDAKKVDEINTTVLNVLPQQ